MTSELRKGYMRVQKWIDEGMVDSPGSVFTEGDCRLAAYLCLEAVKKVKE